MPPLRQATSAVPLSNTMVSVGVTKPLLDRAIGAAWLAGKLCFDSRDYDLDLGEKVAPVIPDAELQFTLAPSLLPTLFLSDSGDALLNVDELHAQGQTVMVVTHEPDIAAHCRRTVRIGDGLVVSDTPNNTGSAA